ncbi:MAG TPA: autotransporter-associated beta strand repeat-containing protein [Gemmatales bacterium]|nr:autotransporter-associated beta strand repeat-containing protein [Gemmatales bacterium]
MSSVRKNSWWRSLFSRTTPIKKLHSLNYRPSFLGLEERITPAFNTSLSLAATANMSIVTAAGTTTFTATATGANVNMDDINTELAAGRNVVVDTGSTGAEGGNIATSGLGSYAFTPVANHSLTLQTGTGVGLVGNITTVALSANTTTSFIAKANQNFSGGGLSFDSIDVRATTGSMTSSGTLSGTNLFLKSATGIGTLGTPLQTQVTNLTANTTTSGAGIFITEADDLSLANVNAVNGIASNNGQVVLNTTNGSLDINGRAIVSGTASITVSVGGLDKTFTINSGSLQTTNQPVSITADRMILGSGANSINPGNSTITLNPFTSNRTIDLGAITDPTGTLSLSSAELGTISATAAAVTVGSATTGTITATAAINYANDLTLLTGAGVTGSSDFINGTASALALNINQAGTSTYSGRIGGPSGGTAAQKNIALTKLGTGTLKLSGNNTYTGTTAVTGGTLIVNGVSGSGATTVQTGATIGGAGTIGVNNVTNLVIQSGGTLSPGDGGIGTLTVGNNLNLNTGSTFLVDIGPNNSSDQVITKVPTVSQDAILAGTTILPLNPAAYTLLSTGGSMIVGGTGFKDVNGKSMPIVTGGPVVVGNQPFTYAYSASGFRLSAVGTTVSVDGSGNMLVTDNLGQSDNWTLSRNGANIRVTDPTNTIFAGSGAVQVDAHTVDVPFNTVTGKLLLDSNTGTDTVVLNLTNGLIPAGGFNYDGGASGNDDVTVNGTGNNDQMIYRATTAVPGGTEFNLNGGSFNNTLTGVDHFSFNGLGGVDTMTVDYVNGDPVAAGGIDFDGGTGVNDTLVVTTPTNANRTGTYLPDMTTTGKGTVTVGAGQIRFTNLAPVDVTGFATFTVTFPNSNDTVDITGGVAFSNPAQKALRISGDSNGTAFETLAVWNVTNLIVDTTTVDGADTITLGNTDFASLHKVTNLKLITGSSVDTVGVSGLVDLGGSLTVDLGLVDANVLTFTDATVNAPTGITQTGDGSNVLAGGTTTLNTTGGMGSISFDNAINGTAINSQSLVMKTDSGNIIVKKNIGDSIALKALTANTTSMPGTIDLRGSLYHAGTQTYTGPVVLTAASVLFDGTTINGPITFNGTLTGVGSDVTVTTSGDTSFNGAVSVHSLLTNGGGTTNVNAGSITTATTQTYNDAVNLVSTTTFTSTGNFDITFNSSIDGPGGAVINTAGNTVFNGTIGNTTALALLTTNAGGTTFINNSPLVRTSGSQRYGDAVRIGVNTNFQSTGNAVISFSSTLDSKAGLNVSATVTTTGITAFGGAVGSADALSSLTTNAGGTTNINGGSVTTTGSQMYGDAVRIGADTTFTSTTLVPPPANDITFSSTLDSKAGFNFAAIVNTTGITTFGGAVGSSDALSSLNTNAGGSTSIQGGAVTTIGAQTFDDAVSLTVDTDFNAGGNISFNSTLDGPGGANVNTIGITTFKKVVGGVALNFLTTNVGGSTSIQGGAVTTTGVQTLNDAVTLTIDTTFTAGGNISFNSTLDGPGGANVNTTAITTFKGIVGGTALKFLTTNTGGSTNINGGSVTTTNTQTYNDAVTLGAATTLTTNSVGVFPNDGSITFGSTLTTSPACLDLTINIKGTGSLTFNGAVTSVGNLLINNANDVTVNAPMTVSTFVQKAGTGTTRFNGATTINRACPFSDVFELDIKTNAIVLNANVTVSDGTNFFETRFNPQAGGVNQLSGALKTGQLRLEGTGTFNLNQPGNDITAFLSANINGNLTLQDANNLEIKPTAEPQIPAGVITSDDNVTLTSGLNFTANNNSATLVNLGAGAFTMIPGKVGDSLVIFNTEIFASSATFGTTIPNPGNLFSDSFRIRASKNVSITVNGNYPQAAALPPGVIGDGIVPLLDNAQGTTITLTTTPILNTTSFDGTYTFSGGLKKITFTSIERLIDLQVQASVYQTTAGNFNILLFLGQGAPGNMNKGGFLSPADNAFVVAPRYVNPLAPYSAPKVAVADIDGNTFPDLIVANGSNTSGVVTVIKGEELASIALNPNARLKKSQILAQFYAFDPKYFGGLFVTTGNVTGDSKPEIIVGTDVSTSQFPAQIGIFSYNDLQHPIRIDSSTNPALADFGNQGVRVAAGSVTTKATDDPDAKVDIVAATGPGVPGKVVVIHGGSFNDVAQQFYPYGNRFKGGVFVAVGDFNGDKFADILTGPGADINQPTARLLVLSGQKLSVPPSVFSPATIPADWYLFDKDAVFQTTPTGVQSKKWINSQGVSSVAFAKDNSGDLTVVAGSPRTYATQLILYKTADSAFVNYFDYFNILKPKTTMNMSKTILQYRDGIALASS